MTKIIAGIEYHNVIVPEFDSGGCPDLLGWDEAMREADDDEQDVWATFHDEDIAKLCKPVIADFFNKHHKDQYDEFISGEPTFLFRDVSDDGDNSPANLDWFWDEVVDAGSGCFDFRMWENKDGKILDSAGKEFDWEGDGYRKQKPSFENYLIACQRHLAYDFEHAIRPVDCSSEDFFNWLQKDQAKLISLGKELYNDMYYQTFGD